MPKKKTVQRRTQFNRPPRTRANPSDFTEADRSQFRQALGEPAPDFLAEDMASARRSRAVEMRRNIERAMLDNPLTSVLDALEDAVFRKSVHARGRGDAGRSRTLKVISERIGKVRLYAKQHDL